MDIQTLLSNLTIFFSNQDNILKTILILLVLLFLLFAIVLTRQIATLTVLVDQVSFSPILKMTGYLIIFTTLVLSVIVILV